MLGAASADPHYRIIIIAAAITPTISAAIMIMWVGLLIMWRSMAKRVPAGSSAIPQWAHLPELACRTSRCIGQMYPPSVVRSMPPSQS